MALKKNEDTNQEAWPKITIRIPPGRMDRFRALAHVTGVSQPELFQDVWDHFWKDVRPTIRKETEAEVARVEKRRRRKEKEEAQ